MIRSLLKRTKFHRAAILLLAMLCTVSTAWGDVALKTKAKVEYIGEGGKVKTATDVPILNADYLNEVYEEENEFIIGSEGQETWYYVEDELDFVKTFNNGYLYLVGTVNIILGDDADWTGEKISGYATLNIYGTGKLTLNNDYDESCIDCTNLNIYGGTISATSTHWAAIVGYKSVNIYGGKVTVIGENYISSSKISLGWTLPDDYINVSSYDGKVTILPEKGFRISGTETIIYSGDIYNNDIIAGKKLQPDIDPNNPPQPIVITKYVSSYEEFISAFASKKAKIVLDKDINYPLNTVISIKNDACLDLNGHSLKFLVPLAIAIAKDCNVEITDHSESKSGKIIYESAAWGKGVINFGTLSVSNICFNIKNGTTSIINNGTLSVSNVTFTGIYNQANGIIANHNSTVIIGSGVSFSGLNKGIYTHYDYHDDDSDPWKARALTRGNDSESESESEIIEEPAKLYFNALPVFESCGYDLYLDKSIMDFSNATAPLALASGQNKITLKNHVSAFTGAYTKDYKRAFTDPATGTTTSPNDIFNYKEVRDDVEPKYLCGELYFIKTKGYCGVADANEGKNVEWTVADNGNDMLKLTISKNETDGQENYAMADYTTESPAPWANFAATINEVVVGDGVTLSSTFPFDNLTNLTAVTVPIATLQDCLANWSDKADVIKSTGSCGSSLNWSLTKNSGDKIGDNFPLKLTISGTGAMADYSSSYYIPWDDVRSNITEVVISDGVTTICKNAFLDCANLASIKISSDVKTIGERAFMHCWALTDVTIPASVESIGDQAFADCETLKTIHMKSTTAPTLVPGFGGKTNYNFNACNALEGILTPSAEAMNNYASADGWRAYADKLGAEGYCGDKNENDGKNVIWSLVPTGEKYQNNALLYALNIDVNPDVENQTNFNMGNADYRNQTNNPWLNMGDCISELNIGEGVTSIAEQAFNSLKLISSVVIPRSIEKIAGSAFGDDSHTCSNLEWVYLKRYDPTAEKKITNLDFFEGKCNTFIGCPELKCIFVDNIDAYNAATSADYWDDDMKAKLREYKPVLFAASATNEWATFCTDIEYFKPENCTVYTVSGVNSEQVQVAEVEGDVIPAYTPVLIKRAEGKLTADIKAEFSNVVENVSTSGTSYNEIDKDSRANEGTVIASYDGGNVYGNTGAVQNPNNKGWVVNGEYTSTYALYGDKFLLIDTDEGIPTHRFIMRVYYGDVGKARSLTIGVGGDTTGMEELKNEKIEELNSEWYDLQGRKLGSKPTRKGLYINNGKKIVIK